LRTAFGQVSGDRKYGRLLHPDAVHGAAKLRQADEQRVHQLPRDRPVQTLPAKNCVMSVKIIPVYIYFKYLRQINWRFLLKTKLNYEII
jgi:hypothetical protein